MSLGTLGRIAALSLVLPLWLAAGTSTVTPAVNKLGLELYREQAKAANGQNVLLSPFSISTALAFSYAGADGKTKKEMERVLHFPSDQIACSAAFQALELSLADVVKQSAKWVAEQKEEGGDTAPITLSSANRLFIQQGYPLRKEFSDHAAVYFNASLAELDFKHDPDHNREIINDWVAANTHNRITQVLPIGQPTTKTRLALVNALYLKAAWADGFDEGDTKVEPFHLNRSHEAPVPTMLARRHFGYTKQDGYSVVTVPYQTDRLQLVLLVPDKTEGLAVLEQRLTAKKLADYAQLARREVILHLPKFKLEPATLSLGQALQSLGLKSAFDLPEGSANFDRMTLRTGDGYLFLGEVFHKTWLSLDEHGTEATAATVALMSFALGVPSKPPPPPIEVRVDRPFMFAIQHVDSGTCLFLGRVTDPR